MAFLTKVITDTSPDFGDNPQIVQESGQPDSVEIQNLVSNTGYWTKAEIWQDGILNDTSETETFTTLPAGTITLEHISTVRSGNGYDVTYRYTSTYAPSSAILSTNSTNFQGFIDSAQHTVSFFVTGLTPGTAYLTQVSMTDIYAESVSVQGTIVATVVNEISITDTESTEDTVECFLEYILDDGFTQGYVEYWESYDDPDHDQPQGHFYFSNGDTGVICDGLSSSTSYQFRATVLQPNLNSVESAVVTAATANHDYSAEYFTIENLSSRSNTIGIRTSSDNPLRVMTVEVSTDDGANWTQKTTQLSGGNYGVTLATLQSGDSLIIRHTGAWYPGAITRITATRQFDAYGNIASLCFGDNFDTGSPLTMATSAYAYLFYQNMYLRSAENLYLGAHTSVSENGYIGMFAGCTSLTTAPDLSNITSVGYYGMGDMFSGCASLTTAPDLSNITSVGNYGMHSMFSGCTSLTGEPDLSGITSAGDYGLANMFYGCSSLTTAPNLDNLSNVGEYCMNGMFYGCSSITVAPDLGGMTSAGNGVMYFMFAGCESLETAPDLSNIASVGGRGMQGMFSGCTSLTTAPDLSGVTSVAGDGMQVMFSGCTSLTSTPDLSNITSVGNYGMGNMFSGCTSLAEAYAPTISWSTTSMYNWLNNVAASGTLWADSSVISGIPTDSASGCPTGWSKQAYGTIPAPTITASNGYVTVTGFIPASSGGALMWKDSAAGIYRSYTAPISLANYSAPQTFYAQIQTSETGWTSSAETTETLTKTTLTAPTISYDSGTGYITITGSWDSYASAAVYYTLDGTTPTSASTAYSAPFAASAGDTVKAIAIPSNTSWYDASTVATEEIPGVVFHDWVHLSTLESSWDNSDSIVGTGVNWDDADIYFRVKGRTKGYTTGGIIVGHWGVNDSTTGPTEYDYSIRIFNSGPGYWDFNYPDSRYDSFGFGGNNGVDWNLTCGNNYVYDNNNSRYMVNGDKQSIGNPDAEIFFDMSCWWISSLEIFDSNGDHLFNGRAAEYNGRCGLYDSVSGTLKYHPSLTAVCEDAE